MSTLLYRLGKTSFAHPFRVLGIWFLLIVAIVGTLAINGPRMTTEMSIEGVPAMDVLEQLQEEMPEAAGSQSSVVVEAPEGGSFFTDPAATEALAGVAGVVYEQEIVVNPASLVNGDDPAAQAAAEQMLELAEQAFAAGAAGIELEGPVPFAYNGQLVPGMVISTDGTVALLQFTLIDQSFSLDEADLEHLVEAAEAVGATADLRILPGTGLQGVPEIIGIGEVIGVGIAAIVLFVALGSIVAAGLPLANAFIGVGVAIGGTFALSQFFDMSSLSITLGVMLGLAVGIDYALFIVIRQRKLILHDKLSAHEATGRAVGTAGSAVFFAGLTVIIALTGLLVIGISMLSIMALIAAATVFTAVLVSLTALPAMLGLVGERIASDKARAAADKQITDGKDNAASRWWGGITTKYRKTTIAVIALITLGAAIPALNIQYGLPSGESYNEGTVQRDGYDAISRGFGEGMNGPLLVVVTSESADPLSEQAIGAVLEDINGRELVASASTSGMSEDGRLAMIAVIPAQSPTDLATEDLVHDLRQETNAVATQLGATVGVTGVTAMGIDIAEKMASVLPLYMGIVVLLSLLVLTVMFRSLLVPIKATIGFVLTILATLGITTAVFQWGWFNGLLGLDATAPVMALLPIIVTGVAYGLAMDYEVFLVSSMRESWVHGKRGVASVVDGFNHSAKVVVAAAVIMAAVFSGFIFNADPMIKQMGLALAVAIAIDAFLVRMTLVPAIMAMLGDRAWKLPKWLDRLLPDLDIEGDKLLKKLAADADDAAEASPA